MPFNGSGVFSLVSGNPVVTGTTISSTWANNTLSDIANNGLTNCLTKDGQQTPTANIPMGGFRITGLGNGVNRGDSVSLGQLQDNGAEILGSISGTGDIIVAASSPSITAYATGSKFIYTPTLTNTVTAPTINISAVGAKTIVQSNGSGLWGGALVVGTPYELYYDGANFRVQSGQLGNQIVSMSSPFGMRNRVIDGKFDLWNSGTSFNVTAGATVYTSDLFIAFASTGGTATVNKGSFAPGGEPAGGTSPCTSALVFAQSVAATSGNPLIGQRIESVYTLEGRSATFSVWLWVPSGTLNVPTVNVTQFFGSSGSASVQTPVTVNWTLTTTPTRFSVRVDIPSISGKTVAGGNDYVAITVLLPVNQTFTVTTTQWQLEDCPAGAPSIGLPTPFETRPLALEQALAWRYLQVLNFPSGVAFAPAYVTSATGAFSHIEVPPLRAVPTVAAGGAGSLRATGGFTWSSTALSMGSANVINVSHTVTGGTAWQSGFSFFSGGLGTITLDARL